MAKRTKSNAAFINELLEVLEKHQWAGDEISVKLADSGEIDTEATPSRRRARRLNASGPLPTAETITCPQGKVPVDVTVRVGAVEITKTICK